MDHHNATTIPLTHLALGLLIVIVVGLAYSFGFYRAAGSFFCDSEVYCNRLQNQPDWGAEPVALALIPEGYQRLEDYTIVIDVAILPGVFEAVWVEYGATPEALKVQTPKMSSELGMGTAGEYGSYSIAIKADALEAGMSYVYRVVGETSQGTLLRSGYNLFTAGK